MKDQINLGTEQMFDLIFEPGEREKGRSDTGLKLNEEIDIALRACLTACDRTEQGERGDTVVGPQRREGLAQNSDDLIAIVHRSIVRVSMGPRKYHEAMCRFA